LLARWSNALGIALDHLAQRLQRLKGDALVAADLVDLVVVAQGQKVLRIGRIFLAGVEIEIALRRDARVLVILVGVIGEGRHDQAAAGPFGIGVKAFDLDEERRGTVGAAAFQLRLTLLIDGRGILFFQGNGGIAAGERPAAIAGEKPGAKQAAATAGGQRHHHHEPRRKAQFPDHDAAAALHARNPKNFRTVLPEPVGVALVLAYSFWVQNA
jgi:hypothetical protein